MKIRRWAGRGVAAVAVGGALIGLASCGDSDQPARTEAEGRPAAATAPTVQQADMVETNAAARNYENFTTQESFGGGCVNAYACKAALDLLRPYTTPLAEALDKEAGSDPYWKALVDLADKVSQGVQYTEPADHEAMHALLKDVVKLRDELGEHDFG
ncbi:hypothetical protein HCJ76_31235 [Streptomyces sp. MC1]|uniref:hypothetical protein n=1 Tax=Streptomyces sp. MC1 TaxID=295105 RepID=UPI0018CA1542|nr:hypothetical protein [Streptomyces sp. MC1]MBG7702433.1 hypothetical protein [Streptomyces sp. MC1]